MSKKRDLYQIISDVLIKNNIADTQEAKKIANIIYYAYCEEYYPTIDKSSYKKKDIYGT